MEGQAFGVCYLGFLSLEPMGTQTGHIIYLRFISLFANEELIKKGG